MENNESANKAWVEWWFGAFAGGGTGMLPVSLFVRTFASSEIVQRTLSIEWNLWPSRCTSTRIKASSQHKNKEPGLC